MTQYGIAADALLKNMIIYIEGNRLVKDEFNFVGSTLTREYHYLDSRVKEIKIIVRDKNKIVNRYLEGFDYTRFLDEL